MTDEPRDHVDGYCDFHGTYLDDGYCVGCLVMRVGELERENAALRGLLDRLLIHRTMPWVPERDSFHFSLQCFYCEAWTDDLTDLDGAHADDCPWRLALAALAVPVPGAGGGDAGEGGA